MDVALLEPREVLRCGLASMLGRLGVVSRLGSHHTVGELLLAQQARGNEGCPDVVIVSCSLSEDVVDLIQRSFPKSRVLKMVASAEPRDLAAATKTHADGFLMVHDTTEPGLDRTLQALMRGELPIPQPIASYLFARVRSNDASPQWTRPYFNPTERSVTDLLLEGLSNRQISQRLGISLHSTKRRVSAVLHKANSPSRSHFVAQMLRDEPATATESEGSRPAGWVKGGEATAPARAALAAAPGSNGARRRRANQR